ncbi:MAG: RDD family protein, partial [Melioribacteraceae bacterium]|nr:RDD family protein [Melioribacteraceae bacterium]
RATGRFFGKILSGLIFNIGYIMAAFTERKQALHDILANCLVVENDLFKQYQNKDIL